MHASCSSHEPFRLTSRVNTLCKICDSNTAEHARMTIRGKYSASLRRCLRCGFLFIQDPTWLAEAYAEPINRSDTGYVWRNLWSRNKVCALLEASRLRHDQPFLDYAAGYGLFVRLMRDSGYNFQWSDLYCQNLFVRGFEATTPLSGPFEAITAFEVLEHLPNPREEIEKILTLTSVFIFSTMLVPEPAPQPEDWWYYGREHGQHVAFYTRKSLEHVAAKYRLELTTDGSNFHVLSRKPIQLDTVRRRLTRWLRSWNEDGRISQSKWPCLRLNDHDKIAKELFSANER